MRNITIERDHTFAKETWMTVIDGLRVTGFGSEAKAFRFAQTVSNEQLCAFRRGTAFVVEPPIKH
jgi:hypothetical protein